jgi:hypothetical protein
MIDDTYMYLQGVAGYFKRPGPVAMAKSIVLALVLALALSSAAAQKVVTNVGSKKAPAKTPVKAKQVSPSPAPDQMTPSPTPSTSMGGCYKAVNNGPPYLRCEPTICNYAGSKSRTNTFCVSGSIRCMHNVYVILHVQVRRGYAVHSSLSHGPYPMYRAIIV